jgi:hypothetical protein
LLQLSVVVVVVVVVAVVVARLAVTLAAPCVHHLMVWEKGKNEIPRNPNYMHKGYEENAVILFILI